MEVSEAICAAGAALFGVDPNSFRSLNGMDGAVYLCRRGELAHVIKFTPMQPHQVPAFHEKLAFITYLAGNGVTIAAPLPSLKGELFELLENENQHYLVTLTAHAPGRSIEQRYPEWGPALFYTWGRTLGQMHALTRQYPQWRRDEPDAYVEQLPDASADTHLPDWRIEHKFFVNWCQEPEIVSRWNELYAPLKALPITRDGYGLIHNDLHQWNFLYQEKPEGGLLTIIDFDVCAYHWFITDITIALYSVLSSSARKTAESQMTAARQFCEPFRRGYETWNHLDESWWAQTLTFLKYRQVLLYIALSNSWSVESRAPWQSQMLKRTRSAIMAGKPVLPGSPW